MSQQSTPFAAPAATTVQAANTQTDPVAEKTSGSKDAPAERRFTGSEVEAIVKDRLARERKAVHKEAATVATSETAKAPDFDSTKATIERDYKARQAEWDREKSQLVERLGKFRQDSLRVAVEKKLNDHDCLDTEVVFSDFSSRNLVSLDEDGNVLVNNLTNNLDDLVKDYLSRKPHLVRASQAQGAGTRGPKQLAGASDPSQMTMAELEAQLGISPKPKNPFKK